MQRRLAALALVAVAFGAVAASADEEPRLKPEEQLRPGSQAREGAKGTGPMVDPTLDSPGAVEQQDVVHGCTEAGTEEVVVVGSEETGESQLPPPEAGTVAKAQEPEAGQDCNAPNLAPEGPATNEAAPPGATTTP